MPSRHIPTFGDLERPGGRSPADHHRAVDDAFSAHLDRAEAIRLRGDQRALSENEERAHRAHLDQVEQLGRLRDEIVDGHPELSAVDWSQAVRVGSGDLPGGDRHLLTRDERVADAVRPDYDEPVDLGRILRAWTLGERDELSTMERRVLAEGVSSSGGLTIPVGVSAAIIDHARVASRAIAAGVQTFPMNEPTVILPKLTGSPTPAWRAENASIPEGDLTLGSVTLNAKALGLIVRSSRELLEDSAVIPGLVERDLGEQVAAEVDRVVLRGSGTAAEPLGIRSTSGITVTSLATNGRAANYDDLLDAVQAVRAANREPNAAILAPRSENAFAKLKDSTGQYVAPPTALSGLTRYPTNRIPVNLTQGTSNVASEIMVGDFTQCVLGVRHQLTIEPLRERYADFGQVGFLLFVRADVAVLAPEAFVVISGVL